MSEVYAGFESFEQPIQDENECWRTVLDHTTRGGDHVLVHCDAYRRDEPSAYRVHFTERGGEQALALLVQKAGEFYDFSHRLYREIVFDQVADHCITGDVQRQEYLYHHDGIIEPLFPRETTPNT